MVSGSRLGTKSLIFFPDLFQLLEYNSIEYELELCFFHKSNSVGEVYFFGVSLNEVLVLESYDSWRKP